MPRPATVLRLLRTAFFTAALGTWGVLYAASRTRPEVEAREPPDPPPGLPPARILAVPGHGELFVRDTGPVEGDPDAPTVLLLHGWLFPADLNWFTVYDRLAASARVLALDHRGHGRGTRPSQPFRLRHVADDAAALLRHLGVERAVVVGYSMGGPVAMLLQRRHPDLVLGLVLAATAATFSATLKDRLLWRGLNALQLTLRLLPRHWAERISTAQAAGRLPFEVSRMITPDLPEDVTALLPWMVGELDRGSAEDLAEAGRELARFDARDHLGAIRAPTAVIVTTEDRLVRPVRQRELAAGIPGAVVFELAADHNVPLSQAGEFGAALDAALARVTALSAPAAG